MMNCTTSFYFLSDQDGRRYGLANNHLQSLSLCMDFMRLVVEGRLDVQKARRRCNPSATTDPNELEHHHHRLHSYSMLFDRQFTFHPYVALFLREYRKHPVRHLHELPLNSYAETGASVREVFEGFVNRLQAEAKRCCLRTRAADWRGKSERNADRLLHLMSMVAKRSSHLTVIELELDFLASRLASEEVKGIVEAESQRLVAEVDAYWSGWDLDRVEPANIKIPFDEVHRDRKRLFANLKGKPALFRYLLGYVWRVGFTPVAGYSLRLSLIFDGAQGSRAGLGQSIGRYWAEAITRGRGCFRELKPWPAIEFARRIAALAGDSMTRRKRLRHVLMAHMGGPLLDVQVMPHPGCNLFGTGQIHRGAAAPERERRRETEPTTGACAVACIQSHHLHGVATTCLPSVREVSTAVEERFASLERRTRASKALARSAR